MKFKKTVSVLLMIFILFATTVSGLEMSEIKTVYDNASSYILDKVKTPQYSQIGGEWTVLALSRGEVNVPDGYFDGYYKNIESAVKETEGVLSKNKYTEYSRVIIALSAIGKDATDVAGYNLVSMIEDYDNTVWQGLNSAAYALIALDCSGNNNAEIKNKYIDFILSRQLADGGFALASNAEFSEPDLTGIVLQALSNHTHREDVKMSIDRALNCLSAMQNQNGGFISWESENSENVAQAIVALCELGIDLEDPRFVKNGKTLMDALLDYRMADGGFEHEKGTNISDLMATEQCAYALAGYLRIKNGKPSLYDMSDVSYKGTAGSNESNSDVKIKPVTKPGRTFDDIKGHINQTAIEKLAEREIINGKSETLFYPDDTMTRAEFATIVVKALGLEIKNEDVFSDVKTDSWYRDYVNTAYSYGIVNGVSETEFAPENTITKEMAAVMLVRAAKICGNDTGMGEVEIRNVLSQFTDYMDSSDWAKASLAYCYKTGILPDEDIEINHNSLVKRCEIAQMIYNMLTYSKLI